jgi:hypothetical protein
MRKLLLITPISVLAVAGIAAAATTAVSSTVTPNTPKKGSTMQVRAQSFPPASSLPQSITIDVQKGFFTATDKRGTAISTKELCSAAQEQNATCPVDSSIGQGNASLTLNPAVLGTSSIPFNIQLFLGIPRHNFCPASVLVVLSVNSADANPLVASSIPEESAIGDLCTHNGGLELSFPNLPTYSSLVSGLGSGETYTLTNLYLSAAASTTVTKTVKQHGKTVKQTVKNNLINNPPSCPASEKWTGSMSVKFASGTTTLPLNFPCKKK